MAFFTNPIVIAKAERATCAARARYFSDAADEVAEKGLDWIATAYREKAAEYQTRANQLSVAMRTLSVGGLAA